MLRQQYMEAIHSKDQRKKEQLQQLIEVKIVQPQQEVKLEERMREQDIIDTNEGLCVICLTSEAHLYMDKCRHLISCQDCAFILRMNKKCPLCRTPSAFLDLKAPKASSSSKQRLKIVKK